MIKIWPTDELNHSLADCKTAFVSNLAPTFIIWNSNKKSLETKVKTENRYKGKYCAPAHEKRFFQTQEPIPLPWWKLHHALKPPISSSREGWSTGSVAADWSPTATYRSTPSSSFEWVLSVLCQGSGWKMLQRQCIPSQTRGTQMLLHWPGLECPSRLPVIERETHDPDDVPGWGTDVVASGLDWNRKC